MVVFGRLGDELSRALVIFHDHGTDEFLSRLLKPGFKHVFCVIDDGHYWIRVDGQAGMPTVEVIAGNDYDLAAFYRGEGFRVVETHRRDSPAPLFVLGNCVGATHVHTS